MLKIMNFYYNVQSLQEDLAQIASAFYSLYEKPLSEFVASEVSGDFKKLLLAVLASN